MKFLLTLVLPLFLCTAIYGQTIAYEDFKAIIPYVQREDFKTAFEKTNQLLASTQDDSSDLRGIVRYMNIFSSAGMVSLDQMSYSDFTKNLKKYVGQYLVMSAVPCVDSAKHEFNALQFRTLDGELLGFSMTSNNKASSIFCFQYFQYTDKLNPDDFIGKTVRSGGILKSFETNPNKSTIWIARLHIANAFARVSTPR
jgi:hypothetical protein